MIVSVIIIKNAISQKKRCMSAKKGKKPNDVEIQMSLSSLCKFLFDVIHVEYLRSETESGP